MWLGKRADGGRVGIKVKRLLGNEAWISFFGVFPFFHIPTPHRLRKLEKEKDFPHEQFSLRLPGCWRVNDEVFISRHIITEPLQRRVYPREGHPQKRHFWSSSLVSGPLSLSCLIFVFLIHKKKTCRAEKISQQERKKQTASNNNNQQWRTKATEM